MGKDKKTKKRDQRERERGVDSWVGVVCVCVCVVCGYGVEGFSFFLLFCMGERDREETSALRIGWLCRGRALSLCNLCPHFAF